MGRIRLRAAGGNAASLGRCLRSTRGKANQGNYICVSTLDYDHMRAASATLNGVICWQTQFGVCPMVSLLPGALSFSTISNLHCGRACMSAATVFGPYVSKIAVASARNKTKQRRSPNPRFLNAPLQARPAATTRHFCVCQVCA